ncbi:NfeD family protein [Candidatus Manganitrophus noduliformans]|uniref:NfeD family protein n=1 Tax=Candidatus Manganitrophus noduliformans TaxID=2606439 RepID=A0A7X6IA67_9BACT|nr:NfeD family protein [Candidatus Manganitrophus noduliformans]NKE70176.1 NfeD family protein [Candidatus Manganitrophus noduliformans]
MDIELWQLWIVAAMGLFIAELLTPGFFTAAIGMGCLAAGLAHWMGWVIEVQITVLFTVTLLVFLMLRPLFLKYLDSKTRIKTNTEALIGKQGYVLEKIDPIAHSGRIIVGGEDWKGVSIDDAVIEPKTRVEVVRIDGTHLIVKQISKREDI